MGTHAVLPEKTGKIKIIRIPAGDAPLHVRQAWVGLILPCHPFVGLPDKGLDRSVLSRKRVERNKSGFSVSQVLAIAILENCKPRAAKWWKDHNYPKSGECFGFAEHEAEIVSGVRHQQIVHVTDDMQGDPNR